MLDLIAAAGIGGIIGFGVCAALVQGGIADASAAVAGASAAIDEARADRDRASDAAGTNQRKLSAIRDLVGPTEGLRRGRLGQIAAILDGERA